MTEWPLYYILDAAGEPVPCDDVLVWSAWLQTANRHVAEDIDEVTGVRVSTVFLGLDHQWRDSPPVLWETMVFGGALNGRQQRYTSRAAALAGHRTICRQVAATKRRP